MSHAAKQLRKVQSARPHRRGGFTLLELILAMTMVAMLSLSLYAAMSTAFKAKTAAERAIAPARAIAIAADLVGKDLESVVLPSPVTIQLAQDPTNQTLPLFVAGSFTGIQESGNGGEAGWMEFTAVGNDGQPDGVPLSAGMRRIDIGLRTDMDPPSLVRRIQRNVLSVNETEPLEEGICRNVKSFAIRYFDGTDWYETWDSTALVDAKSQPALPMIVQIELVLNINDWQQPGQQPNTYSITRMIPINIAKPVDPDATVAITAGRIQ